MVIVVDFLFLFFFYWADSLRVVVGGVEGKGGANKPNRILFFSGKQSGNDDRGAKHNLASEEGRREERSR
jgi:hypothetical protein